MKTIHSHSKTDTSYSGTGDLLVEDSSGPTPRIARLRHSPFCFGVALLLSFSLLQSTPGHGADFRKFMKAPTANLKAVVNGLPVVVQKIDSTEEGASVTVSPTGAKSEAKETNPKGTTATVQVDEGKGATILQNADTYKDLVIPVIKKEGGEQVVTSVQTASTEKWNEKLEKNIGEWKDSVKGVSLAVKQVESAVKAFLKDPTNDNYARVRDEGYDLTLTELIEAYNKATDPQLRTHLAGQYGATISEQKAWYGRDANYSPVVYKKIYDSAASCVAIVEGDQTKPFASGVLIGENLILTCGHQVKDKLIDNLQVWFDYTKNDADDENVEKCGVAELIYYEDAPDDSLSPLDFCVLKIQREANAKQRKPIAISTAHPGRGVSIYLIGHPTRYPQTVHDNAWILFPFQASASQLKELKIAINAEFIGKGEAAAATDHFIQSYQEATTSTGQKVYRYIGNWSGRTLPLIGAECDTFKGDSGSPAILREKGDLIGILVEGQPDQGDFGSNPTRDVQGYRSGWAYHERILPIGVIVDLLDKKLANWRTTYKPQFAKK